MAAMALRLPSAARTSLDPQEIEAVATAIAPVREFLPGVRRLAGGVPVHFLLLRWLTAYGFEELRIRSAALVAGGLAVVATGTLVRTGFGWPQGVAAATLLAFSPLHAAASGRALPHALCAFLVLVYALAFEAQLRGRGGRGVALLAALAALYTSYAALFPVGASLLYACAERWRGHISAAALSRALGGSALAVLVFVPWAIYDLAGPRGGGIALANVGWHVPAAVARAFAVGAASGGDFIPLVFAALAGLGALRGLFRGAPGAVWSIAIAVLGVAGTAGAARWLRYPFDPVKVLFVLPFYLALVAEGLAAATAPLRASNARPAATVALAVALAAAAHWAGAPARDSERSDWRAAANVILRNLGDGDAVAAPAGHRFLLYYAPELERCLAIERVGLLPGGLQQRARVWLAAGWAARLHPQWSSVRIFLAPRVVVDLSPASDPAVYYATLDLGRRRTYLEACHFDLPLAVWARQPLLRDCLRELGPLPTILERVDDLARARDLRLRNPALLQAVTLLWQAGRKREAARLAEAIPVGRRHGELGRPCARRGTRPSVLPPGGARDDGHCRRAEVRWSLWQEVLKQGRGSFTLGRPQEVEPACMNASSRRPFALRTERERSFGVTFRVGLPSRKKRTIPP